MGKEIKKCELGQTSRIAHWEVGEEVGVQEEEKEP